MYCGVAGVHYTHVLLMRIVSQRVWEGFEKSQIIRQTDQQISNFGMSFLEFIEDVRFNHFCDGKGVDYLYLSAIDDMLLHRTTGYRYNPLDC